MMTRKGPDSIDQMVGRNIRIYRLQKRLTQTDLADQLGLTFQQVQKYEKGTNRVGSGRLLKIATFLGVPVTALFKGSDEIADTDKQLILTSSPGRMPIGCCKHSRELIMMVCVNPLFSWSRKLPTTTSELRSSFCCADHLGWRGETHAARRIARHAKRPRHSGSLFDSCALRPVTWEASDRVIGVRSCSRAEIEPNSPTGKQNQTFVADSQDVGSRARGRTS